MADGSGSKAAPAIGAADEHAARGGKLGVGLLGLYGAGAMLDAITTFLLGSLLYFYLTAVCGMSGSVARPASPFAALSMQDTSWCTPPNGVGPPFSGPSSTKLATVPHPAHGRLETNIAEYNFFEYEIK